MANDENKKDFEEYADFVNGAREHLKSVFSTYSLTDKLKNSFKGLLKSDDLEAAFKAFERVIENFAEYTGLSVKELEALADYIGDELEKPEFKEKSYRDIIAESKDESGQILPGSAWDNIVNAARAKYANDLDEPIENIQAKRPKDFVLPIDKTVNIIYGKGGRNGERLDPITEEQASSIHDRNDMKEIAMEGRKRKEISLYLQLVNTNQMLEALGSNIRMDTEDFYIQCAIANRYSCGNNKISVNQIYYDTHGYDKDPADKDREKILNSIKKQLMSTLIIDDKEVAAAWGFDSYTETYTHLLPVTIHNERATINGRLVNSYIEIDRLPPLFEMAQKMNQVITLRHDQVAIDNIRKDKRYYEVHHAVTKQIAQAKRNNKKSCRMLYKTLYENCQANNSSAKATVKNKLYSILNALKEKGDIKSYKEEITKSTKQVGVTIYL